MQEEMYRTLIQYRGFFLALVDMAAQDQKYQK
jgi:hypothetical protein